MDFLYNFAQKFWTVWVAIIFFAIAISAFWPSKETKKRMKDNANIPFNHD